MKRQEYRAPECRRECLPLGPGTLRIPGTLTDCGCEEAGATYRAFSGPPGLQMRVSSAWFLCQQSCSQTVAGRGLLPGIRLFQGLQRAKTRESLAG